MRKIKRIKRNKYEKQQKQACIIVIFLLFAFLVIWNLARVNATNNFVVVSGVVWSDDNKNGVKEDSEAVLSGIDVYLCDGNGNALVDGAGQVYKTQTDGNGQYRFDAEIGAVDNYMIRFQYEGTSYKLTKIVKQTVSYDINSFVNKVHVIYNIPKTSQGKERAYQAKLNQFNIPNKDEHLFYHDGSGVYNTSNAKQDGSHIIETDILKVRALNVLHEKSIFFIYLDNTDPIGKAAMLEKLKSIKRTFDDNDYKIIIKFSEDYADNNFKNEVLATECMRIKVVENENGFETAVAEYLAGRARENVESPFGSEDTNKRNWIENVYSTFSASERRERRNNGETRITASSNALEANGTLVYISMGLERLQETIPERDDDDRDADDTGDKLVKGSIYDLTNGQAKFQDSEVRIELYRKITSQAERDQLAGRGATIVENASAGPFGMVLENSGIATVSGDYSLSYNTMGDHMIRFYFGQSERAQYFDVNGERYEVPEQPAPIAVQTREHNQNNATENLARREQIIQYFTSAEDVDNFGHVGINNYKTRLRELDVQKLIEKTKMFADTDWFHVEWEVPDPNDPICHCNDNVPPGQPPVCECADPSYCTCGLAPPPTYWANLFLQKRKQVDFEVNKKLEAAQITLSDGRIEREVFAKRQSDGKFLDPLYLQVDEEYIHGATLKVQYAITITNKGDVPLKNIRVMDYLDNQYNHLQYIAEDKMITEEDVDAADKGKTNQELGWEFLDQFEITDTRDHNFQHLMPKDRNYLEYIIRDTLNPGETKTLRLVASVTINKKDPEYNYSNSVEIISYNNDIGRVRERAYQGNIATVGNFDPAKAKDEQQAEMDSAYAEEILITQPTGKEN